MKARETTRRPVRRAPSRPSPARHPLRVPLGSVARQVEIPLPAGLEELRSLEASAVALVDVEDDHLRLRFLRSSLFEDEGSTLTSSEESALNEGGVEDVSDEDIRVVQAQAAAAYQELRSTSLTVEEAARHLGVNASRIRQRLADRSLYGLKDENTWLLPAFQFRSRALVPGVSAVLRRLPPDMSPLAAARWFTSPNPDLCTRDTDERPLTPLQWLLGGNPPEAAAELAAAL